jgi:CRP/FNR family transcriptional regulator, cyclic AMP receptor protein
LARTGQPLRLFVTLSLGQMDQHDGASARCLPAAASLGFRYERSPSTEVRYGSRDTDDSEMRPPLPHRNFQPRERRGMSVAVKTRTRKIRTVPAPAWMPMEELQRLLASVDVLETLPSQELRELASRVSLDRLKARETMAVGPREHSRRIMLLLEGRARLYEPGPSGHRLTVSVTEAGTVAGVAGLSERPRGVHVEALMPSVFCLVGWEVFEGMVRRNPEAGLRLSRVLADRIGVLEERLGDVAYREVPARLASAILRLVESEGVMGKEGARLTTPYTHAQLASIIGANREATTRALRALRELGVLEVRDRCVHITDPEALNRAAHRAS